LEKRFSWKRFVLVYFVSAFAGNLMSSASKSYYIGSGAGYALMGVLGM
jgi:membrane associated rhomboid family serine protease